MSDNQAYENTDRELWRAREGDAYAPSIHVTENGAIGINVGGLVFVKSVRDWHRLAMHERQMYDIAQEDAGEIERLRAALKEIASAAEDQLRWTQERARTAIGDNNLPTADDVRGILRDEYRLSGVTPRDREPQE